MKSITDQEYEEFLKYKKQNGLQGSDLVDVNIIAESTYIDAPSQFTDYIPHYLNLNQREGFSDGLSSDEENLLRNYEDSPLEIFRNIEREYGECFFRLCDVYRHGGEDYHFQAKDDFSKRDYFDSSIEGIAFIPKKDFKYWHNLSDSELNALTDDSELVNKDFCHYEKMLNAYASGTNSYDCSVYSVPRDVLSDLIKNKIDLVEFITSNYEREDCGQCSYMFKDDTLPYQERDSVLVSELMSPSADYILIDGDVYDLNLDSNKLFKFEGNKLIEANEDFVSKRIEKTNKSALKR